MDLEFLISQFGSQIPKETITRVYNEKNHNVDDSMLQLSVLAHNQNIRRTKGKFNVQHAIDIDDKNQASSSRSSSSIKRKANRDSDVQFIGINLKNNNSPQPIIVLDDDDDDHDIQRSAGSSSSNNHHDSGIVVESQDEDEDTQVFRNYCNMFKDCCPDYLKDLLDEKGSETALETLLKNEYRKRGVVSTNSVDEKSTRQGLVDQKNSFIDLSQKELECGCCFCDYPLSELSQCSFGHMFCYECLQRHSETIIGYRKTAINCMSTESDGCKGTFDRIDLEKALGPKSFIGYEKLLQEEAIKAANLHGFETCPFCDFGMIMDSDKELDKLFFCDDVNCGAVSCRTCRKRNHLPLTCEEAEKDEKLGQRHSIEEKMTEALLRECPCGKKFFKEDGCNKMTCSCGKVICYVCKKVIDGYGHFDRTATGAAQNPNACPLWDREGTALRNANDVNRALEEAKRDSNVDGVDELALHVPSKRPNTGAGRGFVPQIVAPHVRPPQPLYPLALPNAQGGLGPQAARPLPQPAAFINHRARRGRRRRRNW